MDEDEKKVFVLMEDILTELKKISEYISYLKWEEMCRREIHTKLPKDKLNPSEKGMFIDSKF